MRVLIILSLLSSACATSFRPPDAPAVTGFSAFAFRLTPEQCAQLKKERRTYRATEKTAAYVAGAGAVLTGIFIFALKDEEGAQAAGAGATLASTGVSVFTGSQVTDLDEELAAGGCQR